MDEPVIEAANESDSGASELDEPVIEAANESEENDPLGESLNDGPEKNDGQSDNIENTARSEIVDSVVEESSTITNVNDSEQIQVMVNENDGNNENAAHGAIGDSAAEISLNIINAIDSNGIQNTDNSAIGDSIIEALPIATNTNDSEAPASGNEKSLDLTVQMKSEPLIAIHSTNDAEIEDLLNEAEEVNLEEGEVVMYIGKHGVPKPWSTTSDSLVKREKDFMSGDIAFNSTVSVIDQLNIGLF